METTHVHEWVAQITGEEEDIVACWGCMEARVIDYKTDRHICLKKHGRGEGYVLCDDCDIPY